MPRDQFKGNSFDDECGRKKRYSSERAAYEWGVRFLREKGETTHAYLCPFCKGWHVGHIPPRHSNHESRAKARLSRLKARQEEKIDPYYVEDFNSGDV